MLVLLMDNPHITDFYRDGYQKIEFCKVCGTEDMQTECHSLEIKCNECGHVKYFSDACPNCSRLRKLFVDTLAK